MPFADSVDPALTRAARRARTALAANLRALRAEAGMSQAEVAERSALSTVYIARLEGLGEQNPTLTALAWIAEALGCPVEALLAPAREPQRRRPGRPRGADGDRSLAANPRTGKKRSRRER